MNLTGATLCSAYTSVAIGNDQKNDWCIHDPYLIVMNKPISTTP